MSTRSFFAVPVKKTDEDRRTTQALSGSQSLSEDPISGPGSGPGPTPTAAGGIEAGPATKPAREWELADDADERRPWEDDVHDPRHPDYEPLPPPPPKPALAGRDFEPRPIEAPYKQRRLSYPYVSREPFKANPRGLAPRELEALEEFFRTRQV